MKSNFLRALRYAWPYRRRLLLSFLCAFIAAVLWGGNFTVIYPVLKLLTTGRSMQEEIDSSIAGQEQVIDKLQKEEDCLLEEEKKNKDLPDGAFKEKREREVSAALLKNQSKLESNRRLQYYNFLLRKLIYQFMPTDPFSTLLWVLVAVTVGIAIKGVFEFMQEWLVGSVVNRSLFDLRNRFYRNAVHLDVDQFQGQGTGELMSRFTNDTEMLGAGQKTLFGRVVAEPLRALTCIVIACLISWQLTVMFLVLVPFAFFVLSKIGRMMKRATHRLLDRMASIYKILQESFLNIRVVKAFTMEPYERRRFRTATRDYYHKSMMVVKLDAVTGPVIEVLGTMAVCAALLAGAYLVLQKETHLFGMRMSLQPLEAETLLQLYVLLAAIADPVRKLSSVYTRLQSGAAAADRIFQYMDRQPRVQGNAEGLRLPRHGRSIEFKDVSFSYEPDQPILTNINLEIKAGETIALVGRNGCGKTTLLGLLPRFYDPNHGCVLVDGHDIRSTHLRSLRSQIGVVTQETILFDDTLFNNIAYGNRRARPEDVERAARQACAHEFIVQLPRGYETKLGEVRLSGGQAQRIALARAILRNPSILLLDEFTSNTDAEKDAEIHKSLREFMRGRTTLVITHKLHTLEIADRIVVIDRGRIVDVGTHAELIKSCAVYQLLQDASSQRMCA